MPRRRQSLVRRHRANSAAAFCGVVGLPDPGYGPRAGDGGLDAFIHSGAVDRGIEHFVARNPEVRSHFLRAPEFAHLRTA